MMLLDGCFIIELFATLSMLSKRWMLPVVHRDLIILENQIPMLVLKNLFEETKKSTKTIEPSFKELALRFFNPLMPRSPQMILKQSIDLESTTTSSSNCW